MTEVYANITSVMKYYGSDDESIGGAHVPFNFQLIGGMDGDTDARDLLFNINKWISYMPLGQTSNWVVSNKCDFPYICHHETGNHNSARQPRRASSGISLRSGTHRLDEHIVADSARSGDNV